MAMLDDVRAKFTAQLRQKIKSHNQGGIEPTSEIPGSQGKILVLSERLSLALETDQEFSLHHPEDARMPLGMAWEIVVGPNGRIIKKTLVPQDQAGLVVVTDNPSVLDEVREMVGLQWSDRVRMRHELKGVSA